MANRSTKNRDTLNLIWDEYFQVFLAGVLILSLILAYFLILGPKFQAMQSAIQANIDEQQSLYAGQQKKLANLKALVDLYKKVDTLDLQKFNMVLPDKYIPERLYGELEEIVAQGGWLISSIQIMDPEDTAKQVKTTAVDEEGKPLSAAIQPTKDARLGTINFEVSLNAIDYAGLKSLLRLLEKNLRLMDVQSIVFNPDNSSATLELATYYYKSAP
jgi:hypothetical protein